MLMVAFLCPVLKSFHSRVLRLFRTHLWVTWKLNLFFLSFLLFLLLILHKYSAFQPDWTISYSFAHPGFCPLSFAHSFLPFSPSVLVEILSILDYISASGFPALTLFWSLQWFGSLFPLGPWPLSPQVLRYSCSLHVSGYVSSKDKRLHLWALPRWLALATPFLWDMWVCFAGSNCSN